MAACLQAVQQMVHPLGEPRRHVGDGATGEGAHDELAHTGMQWRIVEHQAGGVVFVQG